MARPRPLSPELALLAACGLASDGSLASQAKLAGGSGFDWARFADLADYHGLGAIAYARLAEVAPGALPPNQAACLRQSLLGQAAQQLAFAAESVSLTNRLEGAGIRSIVLKGMALSHMLYAEHPHWRGASDVDILIDPADLPKADQLLQAAGYARTWPEEELPKAGLDMFFHLANVFNYQQPAGGMLIELHFRPTRNPHALPVSFEELYAGSSPIETGGGRIRGLDGPLQLAYLCWHAVGHEGCRLKWFVDIARALRRLSSASCLTCVTGGASAVSPHPAAMADNMLAALSMAAGESTHGEVDPARQRDVNRVIHDMEHLSERRTSRSFAKLPEEIGDLMYLMRISSGWADRADHLLRMLCDPRDVYALGLGRNMAPVYAVAGPLLSLGRFFSRLGGR